MNKTVYIVFALMIVLAISINIRAKKTVAKPETKAPAPKVEGKVTFVELGSVTCIPCKQMKKVMEEIEKEYKDRVDIIFYDINSDKDADKADKYGIKLIPTQVFLDKNGKEYFRHEGYYPTAKVKEALEMGLNPKPKGK